MRIMKGGSKQMRALWKREWLNQRKELCIQLLLELVCVAALFTVYRLKKALLFKAFKYVLALPAPVYAFLGLPEDVVTGNLFFYLQFVFMFLNIWIAWSFSLRTLHSIWREERTGSIYTLCSQWYSRGQIALGKYIWSIVSFAGNYFLLCLVCSVAAAAGGFHSAQRVAYAGRMAGMLLQGMFVVILFISVSFCYAALVKSRSRSSFITGIIVIPLIIGNLYKIRDVLLFFSVCISLK